MEPIIYETPELVIPAHGVIEHDTCIQTQENGNHNLCLSVYNTGREDYPPSQTLWCSYGGFDSNEVKIRIANLSNEAVTFAPSRWIVTIL